jgi:PIN domain nuclease of toxin-antitoxin system
MKVLLDTHIWLWSLLEPKRLPKRIASSLKRRDTEVWLSPISAWEALMLAERGRVELLPSPEVWVRREVDRPGFRSAPLTHEVAMVSRSLALPHQDPADRFLVATAKVYDLTFATADGALQKIPGVRTLGPGRSRRRSPAATERRAT